MYIFLENDVDMVVFQTLSENDLRTIGIKSFGARRKLRLLVENMKKTPPIETLEQAAPFQSVAMSADVVSYLCSKYNENPP